VRRKSRDADVAERNKKPKRFLLFGQSGRGPHEFPLAVETPWPKFSGTLPIKTTSCKSTLRPKTIVLNCRPLIYSPLILLLESEKAPLSPGTDAPAPESPVDEKPSLVIDGLALKWGAQGDMMMLPDLCSSEAVRGCDGQREPGIRSQPPT
jgi:hypothetical protein